MSTVIGQSEPVTSPEATPDREVIFYDGHCGLCHRWVKFVVPRDPSGERFIFAPLQGEFIAQRLDSDQRENLPDSIVVQTRSGDVLVRSEAILHIMRRLGGFWGVFASVSGWIPRALRDAVYRGIASVRHRIFKRPPEACPIMPPELRDRFRF